MGKGRVEPEGNGAVYGDPGWQEGRRQSYWVVLIQGPGLGFLDRDDGWLKQAG